MSSTVAGEQRSISEEWWGHPKGLYVCFFTEMWERFSFYGMKALLLLYLTKYHLFSDENGYNLLGAYGGLVYAVPVIGGLLADRYLGMRKSVVFGGLLLVAGHFGMTFEGHPAYTAAGVVVRDAQALQILYLSLALIIVGVGFLKPNISTIVGQLYPRNDPRRDSGFTLFYAGINLGAFFSSLLCGWLGERYGWRYGFGAAGIGMLAGLAVFLAGQPHLQGYADPPDAARLARRTALGLSLEKTIYAGGLGGVGFVWMLVQTHSLSWSLIPGLPAMSPVLWSMHTVAALLAVGITWFLMRHCTREQRHRMLVLLVLIACCLAFFALYEETYGSWLLFSDRVMNRDAFGLRWSAAQLTALGALFIFALAPLFAWLWPTLERRGWNPSTPLKTALGLLFAALAFLVLGYAATHPQANGLAALGWFALAYLVLEVGEVALSPIGLSAVTQLSVPSVMSLMMGAWFLGTSYSEVLAAQLGKLSSIDLAPHAVLNVADALARYASLFWFSARIGLVSALVVLLLLPLLRRGMHGIR